MAPLVRTGGSRHTGLAALPHRNIQQYQVSYQQARNYIVKYEAGGVEALRDNRGKRKRPDEMSELEKLRAEVKILKAEKERAEMEASFLKKLEEIERRRG